MKTILIALVAISAFISCSNPKETKMENSNAELDSLLHEYYEERLKLFPLEATGIMTTDIMTHCLLISVIHIVLYLEISLRLMVKNSVR